MTTYKFDYCIYIGKFQPFHIGHAHVVDQALELADNIIFVMGSHDKPRCTRNPFTTAERIELIKSSYAYDPEITKRFHFAPQYDHPYNDPKWVAGVVSGVNAIINNQPFNPNPIKIGLIGCEKDASTFYLKMFPQWKYVQVEPKLADGKIIDATEIRQTMFGSPNISDREIIWLVRCLPAPLPVVRKIVDPIWKQIHNEMKFIQQYKEGWKNAPYPPTFMTVDAVVVQSGHVLLVRRRAEPGKGLYALPGGFVGQQETLQEAVLRELREETSIDVPVPVLQGSIEKRKTYDDPNRSQRGRTITEAFYIRLRDMPKLPKVKGGDDADKAFWMPLSEAMQMRSKFFEDHYSIIEDMLGL